MRIYTYKQNLRNGGKVARVIRNDSEEMNDLLDCEDNCMEVINGSIYETFENEYVWYPEECDFVEGTIEEIKERCLESLNVFRQKIVNNSQYIKVFENILEEIEELK